MGRSLRLALVRRVLVGVLLALFLAPAIGSAGPVTITFTAADVQAAMSAQGASLSNTTYQWGLWAVRAMPIVTGGGYTITGFSTTQTGWGASLTGYGSSPYAANNGAWFYDFSGSEAGYPANPLYMIMDKPPASFESYAFPGGSACTSSATPGCNLVTAVDGTAQFSFNVTLGSGATLVGWQFEVDGSRYLPGTVPAPGEWVMDFFGGYSGYDNGGGLAGNMGAGYAGPLSAVPDGGTTLTLLGGALIGLGALRRKFRG